MSLHRGVFVFAFVASPAYASLEVVRQSGCEVLLEGTPLPAVGMKLTLNAGDEESEGPFDATVTAAKGKLAAASVTPSKITGGCGDLVGVEPVVSKAGAARGSPLGTLAGQEAFAPEISLGWAWWDDVSNPRPSPATYSGPSLTAAVSFPIRRRAGSWFEWGGRFGARMSLIDHTSKWQIERSTEAFHYENSATLIENVLGVQLRLPKCFVATLRCSFGVEYGLGLRSEVHTKWTGPDEAGSETTKKEGVASFHRGAVELMADKAVWGSLRLGLGASYHLVWVGSDDTPKNLLSSSMSGPTLAFAVTYLFR